MSRSTLLRSAALLLIATISWGGMFPVAKAALAAFDGFHLTLLRYGIGALLFAATLALVEGRRALDGEGRWPLLALFGAFGYAGFSLLMFAGLRMTRPEHGAVIMTTMPLMSALLAWAVDRVRPRAATLLAIAVAGTGVALVVTRGDPASLGHDGSVAGDLLILAGAACWVVYTFGATRFRAWSPLRYTALTALPGAAAILALTLAATSAGAAHPPALAAFGAYWRELAYMLVLASFVAAIAWNAGIRAAGAVNGVLFINVVPLTAFAIAIARGERFAAPEIAGALLAVAALVISNVAARRPALPPLVRPAAAAGCD